MCEFLSGVRVLPSDAYNIFLDGHPVSWARFDPQYRRRGVITPQESPIHPLLNSPLLREVKDFSSNKGGSRGVLSRTWVSALLTPP